MPESPTLSLIFNLMWNLKPEPYACNLMPKNYPNPKPGARARGKPERLGKILLFIAAVSLLGSSNERQCKKRSNLVGTGFDLETSLTRDHPA